jgi:ABC-2 type transport system permease protein
MRSLVFAHLNLSAEAEKALNPGITWFGWTVPVALEIATVAVLDLIMLAIAIWEFNVGE